MEIETAQQKIKALDRAIGEAARSCGRDPQEIRAILVTKTVPPQDILTVCKAGFKEFGENRVQELIKKKEELPPEIQWHLVGHLQTNKVKYVVGHVALIHSLDRLELFEEIEEQAVKKNAGEVSCLIQVNSSGEATKYGLAPERVISFVQGLPVSQVVKIRGLMTIGPFTEDDGCIRKAFRLVRDLQGELQRRFPDRDWGILSMGMSQDYRIAIEEGANLLRIGTLFFGARKA
ncbi:MAG: YggS family pyridoxal phosphate-dependent enzyme [Candidatus Omnitrophica bacterium]|nr:YggS family pyridoxal phosphate-dependent enzyme [Candidatus Omnitrophota bacterium]